MKKKEGKKMDEFELWKNKAEYEFRILCEKITTLPGQEGTDEKIKRLTLEALESDLLADIIWCNFAAGKFSEEFYGREIGRLNHIIRTILGEIKELGGSLTIEDLDEMKAKKGFVVKPMA